MQQLNYTQLCRESAHDLTHLCALTIYVYMYICKYICIYVYMYICIYVYMYICIYVYMYICIYVYMYICIYVYMYICIYVYMYICIYVYMYICIYVYMYICIYVYMYICIYVYMYICICWLNLYMYDHGIVQLNTISICLDAPLSGIPVGLALQYTRGRKAVSCNLVLHFDKGAIVLTHTMEQTTASS